MEKCLMDVVTPLIANREPAVLRKPAQCALHHPPVSPQLLAALNSLSCYPAPDGTLPEGFLALFVVVSFVSVKFLGPLSRSATGSLDGLYAVDQLFENHRVVDVCRAEHHTERDASSVRNNMALRARFSFIRRIRSGFWPPFGRDGSRVQTSALPLYLVGFAKAIQEHLVQPLPYPCLLPRTQASPARNSRATAHLLGQHLPGDAAL